VSVPLTAAPRPPRRLRVRRVPRPLPPPPAISSTPRPTSRGTTHTDKHNTKRRTEPGRDRSVLFGLDGPKLHHTCPVTVSPTCAYDRCLVMLGSSPRPRSGPPSSRTSSRYALTYFVCIHVIELYVHIPFAPHSQNYLLPLTPPPIRPSPPPPLTPLPLSWITR
jgi:hypothetical protein